MVYVGAPVASRGFLCAVVGQSSGEWRLQLESEAREMHLSSALAGVHADSRLPTVGRPRGNAGRSIQLHKLHGVGSAVFAPAWQCESISQ